MKSSLSLKIQILVSGTIAVVCLSVCVASYRLFSSGLAQFAHGEVTDMREAVAQYVRDAEDSSAGVAASLASRPDVAGAGRLRGTRPTPRGSPGKR